MPADLGLPLTPGLSSNLHSFLTQMGVNVQLGQLEPYSMPFCSVGSLSHCYSSRHVESMCSCLPEKIEVVKIQIGTIWKWKLPFFFSVTKYIKLEQFHSNLQIKTKFSCIHCTLHTLSVAIHTIVPSKATTRANADTRARNKRWACAVILDEWEVLFWKSEASVSRLTSRMICSAWSVGHFCFMASNINIYSQ